MRIKNNTGSSGVFVGQTIANGDYYTIPSIDLSKWQTDSDILTKLAAGTLIGNDGNVDLASADAIKLLMGLSVEITKQSEPQPFATPTYRTKLNATANILSIAANTNEQISYLLTAERYVTGGSLVVKNAVLGDHITAEVKDIDGVIPVPYRSALCEAHPVVSSYIEKSWVEVQGEYSIMRINTYPLNAKISAGLYLCITYHAVNSGSPRELGVNYHLTKKL